MKRRTTASHTDKCTETPRCVHPADTSRITAKKTCAAPIPLKRGRKTTYIPGKIPKEEPLDVSRLYIRGVGGSIKLDLCGVGTRLSPSAFAYHIPDDSLANIRIHRGDIALIEPCYRALHADNLILLEIQGREVLQRLTKKKRVWYLNSLDDLGGEPVPLIDQPLQGVMVGLVRLFAPLTPVKFRGVETRSETSFMRYGKEAVMDEKKCVTKAKYAVSKKPRSKSALSALALAAETKKKFRLSEIDKKSLYVAWPNTRRR